ncbi:ABC transporter ATP-binding protein [Tengunoibacter tsumagoiensis]|uniref:HlyB/MsbA family ABC transporter n=1 Tax=Tengunoibacter tsumagoiensis TaxID=2014871 RepID=A0A402A817_9CHLR|nr:ABC transporter ATP-binding protein [Tengunoibacter tsumagoiensis]GCE15292.1 HlyB/MsbA family ABC transporter [Tengunoibacter tsumagoiensis]
MTTSRLKTLPFNWRLVIYRPWLFLLYGLCVFIVSIVQIVPGWIQKIIFDQVSNKAPATLNIWSLIALYIAVGLGGLLTSYGQIWSEITFRSTAGMLLRFNLFTSLLRRPGASSLPVSAGEIVSRFRDDVSETSDFPLWIPCAFAETATAVTAIVIMMRINLLITLVIFLPLLFSLLIARLVWSRVHLYTKNSREAAGQVAGFLGELFGAVQAIKVANAERPMVDHLQALNARRRKTSLKGFLFGQLVGTVNDTATTFGVGIMLLLSAQAMTDKTFTVGDFALFVSYLWFTTQLPAFWGFLLGDYKQQEVSINRMVEMIPDEPAQVLVRHVPVSVGPTNATFQRITLETLSLKDLTYQYPGTRTGIQQITMEIKRGSFTVITGRIGSGKTTLIRTLLGLLPRDSGEILWNGAEIDDPARFFIPPHCAYTPQIPRLFSDTLQNNILLGLPEGPVKLSEALQAAVLEEDIAQMPLGLATTIGPRGIRLSGGQAQRTAAARMFVRDPDLLVFDDLSSALDVETEHKLWERLFTHQNTTCLVVTHRRAALQHADQIILLKDGQISAVGTLDSLLESSEDMRELWHSQIQPSL